MDYNVYRIVVRKINLVMLGIIINFVEIWQNG